MDPAWYASVSASEAVWAPELLDVDDRGSDVVLRVRYRFRGHLNAAAARVIDPARMSWVEVSTLDRTAHAIDLRIEPDSYADKLRFTGSILLTPQGDFTQRELDGEVKVRFPLVGGKVEGAIVSGLRDHAAVEERVFTVFASDAR